MAVFTSAKSVCLVSKCTDVYKTHCPANGHIYHLGLRKKKKKEKLGISQRPMRSPNYYTYIWILNLFVKLERIHIFLIW